MCRTKDINQKTDQRFSLLGRPNKIWAVSAIHGDVDRLMMIHDAIFSKITPGDRLIYLGNYTGYGDASRETIDELLIFRRLLLAQPSMKASDITYLRGKQEDLWQKLTQIQFEQMPVDRLLEMMGSGLSATMQSYGISPHDGIMAAHEGIPSLIKWTNYIRAQIKQNEGHECFMMQSKRAAYTNFDGETPLLFVNAGIDISKNLEAQEDNFWNAESAFEDLHDPYGQFNKVIRGYDPRHKGVYLNGVSATLDGGCGFGGSLICANMSAQGEIYELMEA